MIEWILGILSIPIIFWSLFLLESWWLIWATEEESLSGAFWAILCGGSLWVIEFGSFAGLFTAIKDNPMIIAIGFITYLAIGTAWSAFKWYLYVGKRADEIKGIISSLGKEKAAMKLATWDYKEEVISQSNFACLAPDVRTNKKKITTWIILWTPSALWFLLNDPIRRAANWIFDKVKGTFQSISDKVFKSAFKVD